MTIWQSIILGIIQGLTEFLPISSSAHLVLTPFLLGWEFPSDITFVFDVLVQVATLVGVVSYFWRDLVEILRAVVQGVWQRQPFATPQARLGWYLLLANLPAGLAGLLLKEHVEAAFSSPAATAVFLLLTALLLLLAERFGHSRRHFDQITGLDALWIGLFQVLSLFPGVSRSGATITGGMLRQLDRPAAARFSFLLSIPIMAAAGSAALLDLPGVLQQSSLSWSTLLMAFLPGFFTAALVGYLSIHWLLRFLQGRSLRLFALYCVGVSALTLLVLWYRG